METDKEITNCLKDKINYLETLITIFNTRVPRFFVKRVYKKMKETRIKNPKI
jgi:hypothetical protein